MQAEMTGQQQRLSRQPAPEYWCSIAYFELDTQGKNFFLNLNRFISLNEIFNL